MSGLLPAGAQLAWSILAGAGPLPNEWASAGGGPVDLTILESHLVGLRGGARRSRPGRVVTRRLVCEEGRGR